MIIMILTGLYISILNSGDLRFKINTGGKTLAASLKSNASSKAAPQTKKVYTLDRDSSLFSVHNNRQYRLVCKVAPGDSLYLFT